MEPMPSSQATRVLRDCLVIGGSSRADAEVLTLHSLRLFAPNLAYKLGVGPTDRKALGRWQRPETADIYQRETRACVERVWDKIHEACAREHKSDEAQVAIPLDILGDFYFPKEIEPFEEGCDWTMAGMEKDPAEDVAGLPEASVAPREESGSEEDAGVPVDFRDSEEHPFGPLRLGINTHKINVMAHLFSPSLTCIGCGWHLRKEFRVRWIATAEDFHEHCAGVTYCSRAFKAFCVPEEWRPKMGEFLPVTPADGPLGEARTQDAESSSDSDSSSSSGSSSDDSGDAEEVVVKL